MPTPKFPTVEDRAKLLKELNDAIKGSDSALVRKEYFNNYIQSLDELNKLTDQFSEIDADYGLPPALNSNGKELLLKSMEKVATLGETILADAAKNNSPKAPIPNIINKIQELLSGDFNTLKNYDPEKTPLSFPEIQENARTKIIDFRGKEIGVMTNKLSSRIPMTIVDEHGTRRPGVFTKASYVDVKTKYDAMIKTVCDYYDSAEFRRPDYINLYKRALFNSAEFGFDAKLEDITEQDVVNKMKERMTSILPKYRAYLINNNKKVNGMPAGEVSEEQLIIRLCSAFREARAAEHDFMKIAEKDEDKFNEEDKEVTEKFNSMTGLMQKIGFDLTQIPESAAETLNEDFKELSQDLTNLVNIRDLDLRDGQRYDQRNSAMTAVASLLDMDYLISRSENMKYLDESGNVVEGTFMEFADGLDIHGKNGLKEFAKINDDPFAPPCKALVQIADLQVFDYLCGNVDRHGGNMSYYVDDKGNFTGIKAFDNDTSFGTLPIDKNKGRFRQAGIKDLKMITEPMAKKIAALTPEMLKFSLRGRGLTEKEIEASCDRLKELKDAINKAKKAETLDDIVNSDDRLCIMKPDDVENIHLYDIPDTKYALFHNVHAQLHNRMMEARDQGINYDPEALAKYPAKKPDLTEVSTTDRVFSAGGISESMNEMELALSNKVTGFEVNDLSKFMHSSGKWRSMISAVKDAAKAAKKIKREIGKDKEGLSRDDALVKDQLKTANDAMEKVRIANDEYLLRKMKEKRVEHPEQLRGKGKNPYEQRRIDYALKLRKSVIKYQELNNPSYEKLLKQKTAVAESIKMANKRKAKQEIKGPRL